jgi:putative addiction module component (TIGR02574 family)
MPAPTCPRLTGGKKLKQITAADALTLSIPERIQLVEDIWDTIATEPEAIELTEEEKRMIDERLEAYHRNPDLGSPWEDVYKRIAAKQ